MSPEAVAILTEIKATNPFAPFTFDEWRLRQAWREVLAAANITNLRVHDLRHFNAALLAKAGRSLLVIGSMLGHSSQATTQRYVDLVDEVKRDATERVGQLIKLPARKAGA